MLIRYSTVLLTPRVRPRLLAVFLSALPLGVLSLTIPLCVQEWTAALRAAGVISGLFGLGNAIGGAVQGRLIERFGARRLILGAGLLCTFALLGFGAAGSASWPLSSIGLMAMIAGGPVPAITTAVRAWLPRILTDFPLRNTSYALLSALFQLADTVGPVVVSVALLVRGPGAAVVFAFAMILAATIVYAKTDGWGYRHPAPSGQTSIGLRRVLTPGLRTILVVEALNGIVVGATAVAVPVAKTLAGATAIAGIAFAALAVGEVLGALLVGSQPWRGRPCVLFPRSRPASHSSRSSYTSVRADLGFSSSQCSVPERSPHRP